MSAHYGIDFGTTNTACVLLHAGAAPLHLGGPDGKPLPSIVAIDRTTGRVEVGRHVWETREERYEQQHVIGSIKHDLGTGRLWRTGRGAVTPGQVASFILKELVDEAGRRRAPPLEKAAISIPVGFSARARSELRRAAQLAGIEVSAFISEPTAALIRYFTYLRHCEHVVVFDWGGGTLDISVLRLDHSRVSEVYTAGVPTAGDYIDREIAQAVHAHEMERRGLSTPFESMSDRDRDLLITRCEVAKCRMSETDRWEISVQNYGAPDCHLAFAMDRSWFEGRIAPIVDQAIEKLLRTVSTARLNLESLDALLVVGGSSKLNLLHKRLEAHPQLYRLVHPVNAPEWAVAHGGAVVDQAPGDYEITEAVGLVLSDGDFFPLIESGDKADDAERELSFALVEDSRQANLVLACAAAAGVAGPVTPLMRFNVPAQGFDAEPIVLKYGITPDLILRLRPRSALLRVTEERSYEYERLRFAYHIAGQRKE